MYSVVVERFLRNKNAVIVADKELVSYGYPSLTFEVECDNKSFYRMVGSSSTNILEMDGRLNMTIAVSPDSNPDWEEELQRLSIKEPFVIGNMTVYTIRIAVKITPLGPSHPKVSDK